MSPEKEKLERDLDYILNRKNGTIDWRLIKKSQRIFLESPIALMPIMIIGSSISAFFRHQPSWILLLGIAIGMYVFISIVTIFTISYRERTRGF